MSLNWQLPGIFLAVNVVFIVITSKLLPVTARTRYLLLLSQYLILSEAIFILTTRLVYKKLVDRWSASSCFGLTSRILLGPVFVLSQICMILHYCLAGNEPQILSLIVGYSFGYVMYLLAAVFICEVLYLIFFLTMKKRSRNAANLLWQSYKSSKEEALTLSAVLTISFCCFVAAYRHASPFPRVKYINVPIKNMPSSFNNTVIVQLSDMHIGVLNGKTALEKVVAISNSLQPDIVAITGDTVEGKVNRIGPALKPLRNLKAKYGVYLTTGNHDYYTADIDKWLDVWKSQGLKVLHNARVNISYQQEHFYLAGIDDTEGKFFRGEHHGPDYEAALGKRDRNIATVLLSHRPSVSKKAMTKYGRIQLALSGHTHGGQFPLTGLLHYFSEPYFYGLYRFDAESLVYVSTGVFYWAAPLRLIAEGEISHITLVCA